MEVILLFLYLAAKEDVNAQIELNVIIEKEEYTFCRGDSVEVVVLVEGPGANIFVNYLINGEPFTTINDDLVTIRRWFNLPGSLVITGYGTQLPTYSEIEDTIPISIDEFPPPRVNFTGGGINCNSLEPDMLEAHFTGDPPFSLFWTIDGEPDSLIDYNLYDYLRWKLRQSTVRYH